MALYEKDTEGKLVPVTEEVPEEAIRAMERFDEAAIVQRMTTGIASEEFIYSYPIKTKTGTKQIIGVSTDGAYELASMLGNIEILQDVRVDRESDPDYFYAMVRGRDITRNVTLLGVARQCKWMVDEGNIPIRDRLNEHAFVASISKAQRNAILHLAPEEVIVKIINTWSQRGKGKQIRPPTLEVRDTKPPFHTAPIVAPVPSTPSPAPTPAPAITADQIAEQQEKLKSLRMQVHNKFERDLGIGVEKRKQMLKENPKFGVESLLDLSEQQLKDCLTWIEEIIRQKTVTPPAVAPAPETSVEYKVADKIVALGFENRDEQNKLRGRLYTMLTSSSQLALKDDEAKEFITKKGFTSTSEIAKESLLGIIKEVDDLIRARQTPAPPSEISPDDIPL